MSTGTAKRLAVVGGGLAGILLLAAVLIAANVLLSGVRLRVDLTQERLFTLSDGTRKILRELPENVELKLFVNDSAPEVPVFVKSYVRQVEDLLKEYEIASRGRISVQKFDPKPDSDDEDGARKYGLSPQQMDMASPPFYFGLVAASGDSDDAIPTLDPRTENLLEYNVTRLIYRVTHRKKAIIGVISSLPIFGTQMPNFAMPGMPQPQSRRPWISITELRNDYDLRDLGNATEGIPPEIEALMLVHPKDLSDETMFAIDQFVLRGGRLLAFVDPFSFAEQETTPQQDQFGLKITGSDMPRLLRAWGVDYNPAMCVADLKYTFRTQQGDSPVIMFLQRNPANKEAPINGLDPITAQLETMLIPFSGSVSAESTTNRTVTALLTTSDAAGSVSAMSARFGPQAIKGEFKRSPTPRKLAIRLSGTFQTAFPEGKPSSGTNAPPADASGSLKEGKSAAVIVVADVDMIYDKSWVQEIPGTGIFMPGNDNFNFLANVIDQIAGSADLVGVRSRGTFNRPFDRVLALHRQAMESYQDEEKRLEERLNETQRQLRELQQSKKDQSQRMILSAEQKAAIEKFRKDEADTKAKLKKVRKDLRSGIENLGTMVKLINIALVPALVILAGVAMAFIRRRA
jgi:ABC-type uncharacterized transport system involved in gliding motility auxiliary subunit